MTGKEPLPLPSSCPPLASCFLVTPSKVPECHLPLPKITLALKQRNVPNTSVSSSKRLNFIWVPFEKSRHIKSDINGAEKMESSPGETYKCFAFKAHVSNANQITVAFSSYIWHKTLAFMFPCFYLFPEGNKIHNCIS